MCCRISGSVNRDPSYVEAMTKHQRKGGPDESNLWGDWKVLLGHNRLAIVDLSPTGSQPMSSERWTIAYNGELYDHMALRQKIGPMHWSSHSDTATLLGCIEHKGLDWTLNNVIGMYAFAAYDRYDKKIYLAVDPFSIKPLHWYKDAESFAFASSPGALALLKDKWDLDIDAVTDMLALGATRTPLFSGMNRIPGGHYLTYDIEKHTVTTTKYYTVTPQKCDEHELIDAVKKSIQSVKVADVPVFMFLSGGVDSSIVASQCYGMNAVHLSSPEYAYACQVGNKYQNHVTLVEPTDFNAEECISDYCRQSGDCSAGSIVPYITSKVASQFGKVAISANGADEIFGGYHRMFDTHAGQVSHIFRPIKSRWERNTDPRLLELETYVQYDLNKTLDFASMCWGLEVRVPYLNKTVVEMALGIPLKEHGSKLILKRFLEREGFDSRFINRQKMGFSLFSQPTGYEALKDKGVELLRSMGFKHTMLKPRDVAYYRSIAGNFYAWHKCWKNILN